MLTTKKILLRTLLLLLSTYVLICLVLYFFQEKFIFFPTRLKKEYKFSFQQPFEEINITSPGGYLLNGLLFPVENAKGLVFYLHGNAGALDSWADVASRYTDLKYNVFILDYAGYGKSEGSISSEKQLFNDVQKAYDEIKTRFDEDNIVVLGYSIGTGPATKLAADNNPEMLILQAPYYSLTNMMRRTYPIIPTFLLKYKFQTHKFLRDCKMPVVLFHGDKDEVIPYNSSTRLASEMKRTDKLFTLQGQGHNGITDNPDYIVALEKILQ